MAENKESKSTLYVVGAIALVLVIFLVSSKSSTSVNNQTVSGTGGILAGLGSLLTGAGRAYKDTVGSSSGYTPEVQRGEDSSF